MEAIQEIPQIKDILPSVMPEKILSPDSTSGDVSTGTRCSNCGYGFRHKDGKDKLREWCLNCITRWEKKQNMTPERAEKIILNLVEPMYCFAKLDDLDKPIKDKLLALKPRQDLYLYGPVGTGKTYALAALIRHNIYEGFQVIRTNFDDLCLELRSSFAPASTKTEWQLVKPLKEIDILVIDDLALRTKQESDFSYVTLFSILNKRQEKCLPTFVSSNKNLAQIEKAFDSRIASRFSTALAIEMTGKDRRGTVSI